jgi:outer membrane beta-barrel protein
MKGYRMKYQVTTLIIFLGAICVNLASGISAWGADQSSPQQGPTQGTAQTAKPAATGDTSDDDTNTGAERVNTENIKNKYWARGDESELGVVQNRTYSKSGKFEFSLLGGVDFTDPFLNVYTAGARFGYHFNEYFSLHVIGWKAYSGASGTQTDLLSEKSPGQLGTALNTNAPKYYVGTEAQWSLLYGKLSLLGESIIHYDFHLMAGFGAMSTQSGTDFEQHIGVGQQFFLGKASFVNVDYRLMHYQETILQQVVPTQLGDPVGTRQNFSNVITVGFGFLFGSGAK